MDVVAISVMCDKEWDVLFIRFRKNLPVKNTQKEIKLTVEYHEP
jgi:hypothetical protein